MSANKPAVVRVADRDNVAIALRPIAAGERVAVDGASVVTRQEVPAGHKIALELIHRDDQVTKYGVPIGNATEDIQPGDWIHSHNLKTALSGLLEYRYAPSVGNRESGIGNRESRIGSRESGIGSRESGIGNRESGRPRR